MTQQLESLGRKPYLLLKAFKISKAITLAMSLLACWVRFGEVSWSEKISTAPHMHVNLYFK